jgi:hypothetical protein
MKTEVTGEKEGMIFERIERGIEVSNRKKEGKLKRLKWGITERNIEGKIGGWRER